MNNKPHHWIVPDFGFLFPTEKAANLYLKNIGSNSKPIACYINQQSTIQNEPSAWLQIGLPPFNDGVVIPRIKQPKTWDESWWKFEPLYKKQ